MTLVAFVAGERYHELCRNHVLHMRRAGVHNYVLVALDAPSLRWLQSEREPAVDATHLVEGIPEGGADQFGTASFFAINGARYRALLTMLQAGVSVFVLDLDVAVLHNPLDWLGRASTGMDILVQSDASTTILKCR